MAKRVVVLGMLLAITFAGCTTTAVRPLPDETRATQSISIEGFMVLSRSAWTRAEVGKRAKPQTRVNRVIVSSAKAATAQETQADVAATLEALRRYHRDRSFDDISWHFAVDRAGRIWELRPLAYQPQATRDLNSGAIAVAILGGFEKVEPTPAQNDALLALLRALEKQYGLGRKQVFGKQELIPGLNNPGDAVMTSLMRFRQEGKI